MADKILALHDSCVHLTFPANEIRGNIMKFGRAVFYGGLSSMTSCGTTMAHGPMDRCDDRPGLFLPGQRCLRRRLTRTFTHAVDKTGSIKLSQVSYVGTQLVTHTEGVIQQRTMRSH